MIIDTIGNASKYAELHPLFAKAIEFIRQTDLLNQPDGKLEIAEGLTAIFTNTPGKTREASMEFTIPKRMCAFTAMRPIPFSN